MSTYDLLLDPELIYKVGRTLSEDRFKKTNLRSTPSDAVFIFRSVYNQAVNFAWIRLRGYP